MLSHNLLIRLITPINSSSAKFFYRLNYKNLQKKRISQQKKLINNFADHARSCTYHEYWRRPAVEPSTSASRSWSSRRARWHEWPRGAPLFDAAIVRFVGKYFKHFFTIFIFIAGIRRRHHFIAAEHDAGRFSSSDRQLPPQAIRPTNVAAQ